MIKTKIDLNKLEQIAELTKPARTKHRWKRDFFSYRYAKHFEKAFQAYGDFWVEVVKTVLPQFDLNTQKIFVTAIRVSPEADKIIQRILPDFQYLMYAPVVDMSLKDDECLIDEANVLGEVKLINTYLSGQV